MEQGQGEIDTLNGEEAIALWMIFSTTVECHIVESEVLKVFNGPRGEHDPGKDGVDKKDEGICNSCCHADRSQR